VPRVIRSKRAHIGEQRAFLATPAYGDVSAGFASALFDAGKFLSVSNELFLLTGNCHVDDSRNECVRSFLETDCTDLVFLDADMRWDVKDLERLLSYDLDIVGGTYPLKQSVESFPVLNIKGEENGLIEVDGLPTGFLRIKREVLQTLYDKAPKFRGKKDSLERLPLGLIFERTLEGGNRYGGDYTFCKRATENGYRIFLDPDIDFNHFGEEVWSGNYKRFRRKENGEGTKEALEAISNKTEEVENLVEFYSEWGNKWSASIEFLKTCISAVRNVKGDVLEMGAGMTTLAMAKANPDIHIHSFEHDLMWAEKLRHAIKQYDIKNVTLYQLPLKDYCDYRWYDIKDLPRKKYELVICDGPPRIISERKGLFDKLSNYIGILLMDDVDDPNQLNSVTDWAVSKGRNVDILGEERSFAISV
jgi:predicted O-methyltransferase YrrM